MARHLLLVTLSIVVLLNGATTSTLSDKRKLLFSLGQQVDVLHQNIIRDCPDVAESLGIPVGKRDAKSEEEGRLDEELRLTRTRLNYLSNAYSSCVVTTTTVASATATTGKGERQAFVCTFDDGLCGFTQDIDDRFDWSFRRAPAPSWRPTYGSGPKNDHTSGTGIYAYIDPNGKGVYWNARLVTPTLTGAGTTCVQFWYHFNGHSLGKLEAFIHSVGLYEAAIFSKERDSMGDQWNLFQVTMTHTGPFQVIFDARTGRGYSSVVGLDDVNIHPGPCIPTPAPTTTPVPTLPPLTGNLLFSCDFEKTECTQRMEVQKPTGSTFNWTRTDGKTPSPHTGPMMGDHTTGTLSGFYMFAEASMTNGVPVIQGMKAWLKTPKVVSQGDAGACVQFAYNMNGPTMGTLGVATWVKDGGWSDVLWQQSSDQGDHWVVQRVHVDVPNGKQFLVSFEATRGRSYKSDMSIDDISVHSGACP